MPAAKKDEVVTVAYVRGIPNRPLARQKEAALAAGIPERLIYEEGRKFPEYRTELLRAIRVGETVWVTDLPVLATDRQDLLAVLKRLAENRNAIFEHSTGERSEPPHGGAKMAVRATKYWAGKNKRFGDLSAVEAGSKGGQATAAKTKALQRMPKREARRIWRDDRYKTDEAVEKINSDSRYPDPWNANALYTALGPRDVKAGPKQYRK